MARNNQSFVKAPYAFGFHKPDEYIYKSGRGLSERVIRDISAQKGESQWMLDFRLRSLAIYEKKSMPSWGPSLADIQFENLFYYLKPVKSQADAWKDLPDAIRETYDRIGIPEMEKKFLSGVSAQYESEVVYKSIEKTLNDKGVIFTDMDTAVKKYPELVKKYFGKLIPPADNKFAALNSAVWSGGSFIYVPKNVSVGLPLQAYFRINAANMGQFERTLIIADEGSYVHYIEGCTAPIYSTDSLHSAVVEIFVEKGARVRYSTVQNWSTNVYNLVTKRARVEEEGIMEWVDGNIGSKITMKYPSVYLVGKKAHGEVLSVAYAGKGQIQDTGGKMMHLASETTSQIISKSISGGGGRTSYRGLVHIASNAKGARNNVVCDALILDSLSRSDTYPKMDVLQTQSITEHEASVSRISDEQLFYLTSRGVTPAAAASMIVNGFIEPIVKALPLEYAVELNRLMDLEMLGSVG